MPFEGGGRGKGGEEVLSVVDLAIQPCLSVNASMILMCVPNVIEEQHVV